MAITQLHTSAESMPDITTLARFVKDHPRLFVLTGAGCSTSSGIPDYRDTQGAWKRKPPVYYQEFVKSPAARQRYWARSLIGWRYFAGAQPNAAHTALTKLEAAGFVQSLVTQNVDGLHQQAGSRQVIDLHGRLDTVRCLGCGAEQARSLWQTLLETTNPGFVHRPASYAPDGDADLETVDFSNFHVPACPYCHGIIKPHVVFFGESVPRIRVAQVYSQLAQAAAVLVVGSSLMVYSGYRFCRTAIDQGLPIAVVNQGRTRVDDALPLKLALPCAEVLSTLTEALI